MGAREWLEMGGEKKPLGMSELGCGDGCGRRGYKGEAGNGRGEEVAGNERAWLRGRLWTACLQGSGWNWVGRKVLAARTVADGVGAREWVEMGGEKKPLGMSELGCVDGCGRRGCKGVAGNGWGEEAAGEERAWLHGRLRTARLQGSGWKWVGRRSRWRSAAWVKGVCGAIERQEWLVCSHDATYQVLFSAIGQVPVQQKQGEFHAVTRFSGAVPGFSLQRTESCSVSGGHC